MGTSGSFHGSPLISIFLHSCPYSLVCFRDNRGKTCLAVTPTLQSSPSITPLCSDLFYHRLQADHWDSPAFNNVSQYVRRISQGRHRRNSKLCQTTRLWLEHSVLHLAASSSLFSHKVSHYRGMWPWYWPEDGIASPNLRKGKAMIPARKFLVF